MSMGPVRRVDGIIALLLSGCALLSYQITGPNIGRFLFGDHFFIHTLVISLSELNLL